MTLKRTLACEVAADGIPSCVTGPASRIVWVVGELRTAWRDYRRRSNPDRTDHDEDGAL